MANIPPKYDDLGKESKDVFGKGYGKAVLKKFCLHFKKTLRHRLVSNGSTEDKDIW